MSRRENQLFHGTKKHFQANGTVSMRTAEVHVFSDSVFSTSPGALNSVSASKSGEQEPEAVMKSDTCKKTETTLQVCRLTLNGTCVRVTHVCKYCTSCKDSCWRHEPDNLPDRIIVFASMLNDMTNWRVRKFKSNVWLKRVKWLFT